MGTQLISVGSEKRGAILNSLTFLFQFLSFVKVWALGFSRFVLYVQGHDLGFKGIASLPPLLCVLSSAHPGASVNSTINSIPTSYLVLSWALLVMGSILREGSRGCSDWRHLASFPPSLDSPVQRAPCTSRAAASWSPPHPQPRL